LDFKAPSTLPRAADGAGGPPFKVLRGLGQPHRQLRESQAADEDAGSSEPVEDVTVEDKASGLEALERKYGDGGDIESDIDFSAAQVEVTAAKAREWGKQDGAKAVALAREEALSDLEGIEVSDRSLPAPSACPIPTNRAVLLAGCARNGTT
jgi:hypothetical protein